ncbi:MAG: class I mannose-6-phosphate isomerase [Cytophagales bacterium]|nr:class I mannose-6-phosphate isomerase [Cytophagales bacterium]
MQSVIPLLKFEPIFLSKPWGGDRIASFFSTSPKSLIPSSCGEAWLLSDVPDNPSRLAEGKYKGKEIGFLIKEYGADLLGEKCYQTYQHRFPLLIKIIHAQKPLSIQVHPKDQQVEEKHGQRGKTEMWYILETKEKAQVISGFHKKTSEKEFGTVLKSENEQDIFQYLKQIQVKKGDAFFVPAGRIHGIGRGILLAEIQESSDITYRVYDFGRDRQLHIKQALSVLDFHDTQGQKVENLSKNRIVSDYFVVQRLDISKPTITNEQNLNSFRVYLSVRGKGKILDEQKQTYLSQAGDCHLIPATHKKLRLEPLSQDWEILNIHVP